MTENQKLFKKQQNRIKRFLKRNEQKGYIFPEDVIPEMPKRVTQKALREIRAVRPTKLFKEAKWVDVQTGELKPAEERRREIRKEAARKAQATKANNSQSKINFEQFRPEKEDKYKVNEKKKDAQFKSATPDAVISLYDKMVEKIENIERKVPPFFPLEARKFSLLNLFYDTWNENEEKGTLDEYKEYLKSVEAEINENIEIIEYDSKQERIEASFAIIGRLIKGSFLSKEEQEKLSALSENL